MWAARLQRTEGGVWGVCVLILLLDAWTYSWLDLFDELIGDHEV